ncbi:hypothetical protein N9139_00080 [Akkermansiaceae bacterium]|nr:hypothetical protein [Akkermansiaceae bacterium]
MKASIILQKTTHYLSTSLTLVSQRLPFIQHFAPLLTSPASLRIATPLVTTFAGTHTLTGQTTTIMAVTGSENPLNLEVGQEFTWQYDSGRHDTQSSEVLGLPPGATYTFGYDVVFGEQTVRLTRGGTIKGAVSVPGTFQVTITGYRFENQTGSSTPPYSLTINVTNPVQPPTPQELYEEWRMQNWNAADAANDEISGVAADPDGDDIPNLLEYTLGLDPNTEGHLGQQPGYSFKTDPDDESLLLWEIPYIGDGTLVFEENVDLSSDVWTAVPAARIEILPNTIQMRVPKSEGTKFFRLRATF